MKNVLLLILVLLLPAACQPDAATAVQAPTALPFPTVTPGRVWIGELPTPDGVPLDGGVSNPATAVAQANRPTPTPDFVTCPPGSDISLPVAPSLTGRGINADIVAFLSSGGSVERLQTAMQAWGLLGDNGDGLPGEVRGDIDLTGEGTPEIIINYLAPDDGGTLLILGCVGGRYNVRYTSTPGSASLPQIVLIGDMNRSGRPDVLFTAQRCREEDGFCYFQTQLIEWDPVFGQFVALLQTPLLSASLPVVQDIENPRDEVLEIIVRLDNPGSAETGPLRTGLNIYDWNGVNYVLSIVELAPPQYRIQVLHEADRAFARREMDSAAPAYALALDDPNLRFWFDDEPAILASYALYRLLLTYAYTEDDRLLATFTRITDTFPDRSTAPVYVEMSAAFWDGLQVTNNLNSACLEALEVARQRPEAVNLLNRYGSRSPVYTLESLCPF